MSFDPSIIPDSQRIKLSLDSTPISTDQTVFPLTVVLDSTNPLHDALFTNIGTNSKKISIESGSTQLPIEIEYWDATNKKATLHTKVPTYLAATNGELVLSYDNSQVDNANVGDTGDAIAQSVWDSNYVVVYHMAQDPSGAAPQILDSTSNANHGTTYGTMTSGDLIDGLTGKAIDFDGVDDYVTTSISVDLTEATVEVTVKSNSALWNNNGLPVSARNNNGYIIHSILGSTNLSFYGYSGGSYVLLGSVTPTDITVFSTYVLAQKTGDNLYGFGGNYHNDTTTLSRGTYAGYINLAMDLAGRFGDIFAGEYRLSNIRRSDDWIKLTDLSLRDQLITWSAYASSSLLEINTIQFYALAFDYIYLISEQIYSNANSSEVSFEQIYSAVLEIWNTQYYGDVKYLHKSSEQPYAGAALLTKIIEQRWGSPLDLLISTEQPYTMPDMLQIYSEQGYGIAAAILQKTTEQLYAINQNTMLFTSSLQAYSIAGETAAAAHFDTKLYINGERLHYVRMQWESSESDYFWSCEVVLHGYELAAKCVEGAEMRIDSAGESYYLKCYDGWMRDKRFGSESYRVKGKSKAWDLSLAAKLSGDIAGGMASQIVTDLAAPHGITIDWQMDDGYIADGKIVANNESPLDVIRKIVWDTHGKLRPTLDGNLIAAYEEETPIPDYPTTTPADTIIARIERRSTSSQADNQPGYNKFIVSDQLAAGNSRNLVKNMIDGHTAELHEFATPIADVLGFTLRHTGPSNVTIEPFGIMSEEIIDELVEIKAGAGRVQKPIYGITQKEYQAANLGNIIFGEDGIIETEIAEYSLIKISYVTKYYKWIARHQAVADVQFIAEEVQP